MKVYKAVLLGVSKWGVISVDDDFAVLLDDTFTHMVDAQDAAAAYNQGVPRLGAPPPTSQEARTPAPLRAEHEHQFIAQCPTADPNSFVEDCACGARRRVSVTFNGARAVIEQNAIVEGGSLGNSVLTVQPGGPPTDRWRR